MGHLVEFIVHANAALVESVITTERGFWLSHAEGSEPPRWEGTHPPIETLWIEPAEHSCLISLPIKYSQFLGRESDAAKHVHALEDLLFEKFPETLILRLDEFLRLEWQQDVVAAWWQMPRPIEDFLNWSRGLSADARLHYAVVAVANNEATLANRLGER